MQKEAQTNRAAAFEAMQPKEGAAKLLSLLNRLTVFRGLLQTEPAAALAALCGALAKEDADGTESCYHALTAALLNTPARRVTGDVWKDFLFGWMLEQPNRFSALAACGQSDPAVFGAMAQELRTMQQLFSLTDGQLFAWGEALRAAKTQKKQPAEKKYGSEENISRMAASAWGNNYFNREKPTSRPAEPQQSDPAPQADPWTPWLYDAPEEEQKLAYAADEGLAVVYRLFLAEEDWGKLVSPLSEFHSRYGTGKFLRFQALSAENGTLSGVDLSAAPHWDTIALPGSQKEQLYANTLRFLHTGRGENVLLYGPDGMGKRELVLALCEELPELRLVLLNERELSANVDALRALEAQPFRFVALLDGLTLSPREYRRLKAAFCGAFSNVLLYAVAPERPEDSALFGLELAVSFLSPEEFCREVNRCLHEAGSAMDQQALSQYVRQWQENGGELSLQAASRLAQRLLRSRES